MKTVLVILVLLVSCSALFCEISLFKAQPDGFYAGKLATYASGDTIMFVSASASPLLQYQFHASYDSGVTWETTVIPVNTSPENNLSGSPTLFYSPEEIVVTAGKYFYRSTDYGQSWQEPTFWGGSFDNSPYIEKHDGNYKLFELSLPYPEDRQDEFVIPGTNDFPEPQVFVQKDKTTNDNNAYFIGYDEIQGPVKINGDLRIKQMGGGYNNNWPTFLGPVVIGGEVLGNPEIFPLEQIFRGGLIEHAPQQAFPTTSSIRQNSQLVGPAQYDPETIVMITVDGDTYSGMIGQISLPRRVFADVWADYPYHPYGIDSAASFRNNFTVRDTVWTALSGGFCANSTMFVNSKLWIKGQFSGKQTWCSADTMMLIGDITLSGTAPGTDPFDNPTDFVNLVSETSILLKYGYWDPIDTLRIHPLCRADNDPIQIYASLYALGEGNGNSHKDGVFSFEYQHPHGSIPALVFDVAPGTPQLIDWIDLHRNAWPQTTANPWPPQLDLPWYNPLWPEAKPYLERGTITQWGTIAQTRRGFLRRSYYDAEHPSGGIWNPDTDYCGATSAPNVLSIPLWPNPPINVVLQTRNFPGATGSGIGYWKEYHSDLRRTLSASEDSGVWPLGLNLKNWTGADESSHFTSYFLKQQLRKTTGKSFTRKGNTALYSVNDLLVVATGDTPTDLSSATQGAGTIQSLVLAENDTPWVYQLQANDGGNSMLVKELNPNTGLVETQSSYPVTTTLNDIAVMPNGQVIMAKYDGNGSISLWRMNNGAEIG
ncbi:MAG: hypothetical protein RBS43_01945, partial [Candidatus Cloacimonas sp.]|nr:hypothetical protein [Candidatus Cloacimonas sp.]